jgi:hypothetical protein
MNKLADRKEIASISLLASIKIYEIVNRSVLQGVEDAEKIATTIVSRAIHAQSKGITLFAIDFAKVDAIDRRVAAAVCMALVGIVDATWHQYFVLKNLQGPARQILEMEMNESNLVAVLLEEDDSPQLFGDRDTVASGIGLWEYLLAQGEWKEVRQVIEDLDIPEVYARAHLTRLYDYGLAFKYEQPRHHLYRAVGLKEDLKA